MTRFGALLVALLVSASPASGWGGAGHQAIGEAAQTRLNDKAHAALAKILIGGEVDKMISLLLVSALLAIAAHRARQLLERAVSEQAASTQLARFFSPEIAEHLIKADELLRPGEGESREAAAMFIDLRGFTKLAATLEPKALIALLGEYQRIAVPIVQRHRGSITTYLGDGIMVTYGTDHLDPLNPLNALRTAILCQETLQRIREEGKTYFKMGIAIHYGRVHIARFIAALMPGPHGEPPGRGVVSAATIRAMITPAPAPSPAGCRRGPSAPSTRTRSPPPRGAPPTAALR